MTAAHPRHGQKVRKRLRARQAKLAPCTGCGYAHNVAACPRCKTERPAAAPRKKPTPYEDRHQQALFDWAALAKVTHPELEQLYHVPNGGARNGLEAARLQKQGVKPGVLDLNLDIARGGAFGLRIELKATAAELGRTPMPSPEQRSWLDRHRANGYRAAVCAGWEAARDVLLHYLSLPPTTLGKPDET